MASLQQTLLPSLSCSKGAGSGSPAAMQLQRHSTLPLLPVCSAKTRIPSAHPQRDSKLSPFVLDNCTGGPRHLAVLRASRQTFSTRCFSSARASEPVVKEMTTLDDVPSGYHHYSEALTVRDVMGTQLFTAKPTTSIQEALEMLVEHRITGLPVIDDDGTLVGVVSDYDLLAIDALLGTTDPSPPSGGSLFPKPDSSWKAFKEIRKLLSKTHGQVVADVMTAHPITVKPELNLDEAARLLLGSQLRRLPVVDSNGKLVGLLTRGNLVRAALDMTRRMGQSS